ncbi:MAG: restriction endonuclease [Anaerovibrio sp.]|uniref:restriction endonuclease n=1 Tax=Anaerovibrio sp. TaxID=1872532 RepID=UPI0025B9A4A2|nr:restriction endonuclease [Anaerovibrio sp.]MBE6100007.1 restriction endonuclease [Anaerovibrio sp.]
MEVAFDDLEKSDLYVDCIYKGGTTPNISAEPFHKLIPGCENSGGFRKKLREDGSGKYAYVVLYTSMEELEWPDYLDKETGIFRYYGDNRKPGQQLINTKKQGNKILEMAFHLLNEGINLKDMPPFLVFKKTGVGRDVQFLGLAAPGNPKISPDRDLVAFWRTVNDDRFQNYEAYFTILDTGQEPIQREWIKSLIYDHENNLQHAPEVWKKFVRHGRNGITPLAAPRMLKIPTKFDQLPAGSDTEGLLCLEAIRKHYAHFSQGFEVCATNIVSKMDTNFINFEITRPWRDGGRDALGIYSINTGGIVNPPLKIDCALEAKCYAPNNSVGVKEMSRLISRIRYRQFGVMITTSYVDSQAYKEVVEDGHPILIVTATDIAGILRKNSINSANVYEWLTSIDKMDNRHI